MSASNVSSQPLIRNPATNRQSNILLKPSDSNLLRTRRAASAENVKKEATGERIPLIEVETVNPPPPLANPETDEDADERDVVTEPYPGVDDGFFSNRLNPDGDNQPSDAGSTDEIDTAKKIPTRGEFPMSPRNPNKPFFPDVENGTSIPDLESIPDINVYQHKKTLAQGMMDLALFSANANQLRYVLENNSHPYFYSGVILISISLVFQVLIGVGLIWNSRYNVKDDKEICIANKISNFTIIGIFLVTVVNVFISAFGVASVQPVINVPPPVVTP